MISWGLIKDCFKFLGKCVGVVIGPIVNYGKDVFMGTTTILGPGKAGKSTLGKILRGESYYIGEYNHTSELVLIKNGKVTTYESASSEEEYKLKIKNDVPGEDFNLWKKVIKRDKPKGIILIVDLYGLVEDGVLNIQSEEEFVDFDAVDQNSDRVTITTTPKKKFQLQVESFKTVRQTCIDNDIKLNAMMVFLNKFEKWQRGADLIDVVHKYKELINEEINLTTLAKSLGLSKDIQWEVTSLNPDYHDEKLEPAIKRFSKMFA